MGKPSFNFFRLLIVSAIAGTVSILTMILFASLNLIDPYEGLINLLIENNIDSSADFSTIGSFFDYWNLITFALISGNFLDFSQFTLTNVFFLLALSIGCLTIALISGNFLESFLSTIFFFVSLMIFSVVFTQFTLVEIQSEDFPPDQLQEINDMKASLLKLTFLIPVNKFIQLAMTFLFCLAMNILISTILRVKQRRIPTAPPIQM